MSPEYVLNGVFSIKSDVFSFGVVLLEIISGKRNIGFYQSEQALSLIGYVSVLKFYSRWFIYFLGGHLIIFSCVTI